MAVKTRFAPSPTGFMHVGGVRTALFAWLVAKGSSDGQFILRIEDTDKVREVEGSEAHIKECLRWLGLDWDEGVDKDGPNGSYRQSERLDIYKEWAEKLVESGRAYADTSSPEELNAMRDQTKAAHKPFLFREFRPENTPTWEYKNQPLRFKSDPKVYTWHDGVMGDLSSGPESIDDFILIKSDGYPTYNFAHIVDDYLMGITHVMRSQEFLPSVPKFLNLYEALEITPPIIATLPFVLGSDGNKKLSKRDGAKDILDYKKEGFLSEALVNFMATLGWNDGTKQEIFSVQELIEKFDLSRVQKSGARFDEQRLNWMNGHYLRELPINELAKRADSYWPEDAANVNPEYRNQVLGLVQERLKFLGELSGLTNFFFNKPSPDQWQELINNPVDKKLKDIDKQQIKNLLGVVLSSLKESNFDRNDIQERLNQLIIEQETKPAILFPLIRIGVSGSAVSPEIFGTLSVLGKEESIARLEEFVAQLDA